MRVVAHGISERPEVSPAARAPVELRLSTQRICQLVARLAAASLRRNLSTARIIRFADPVFVGLQKWMRISIHVFGSVDFPILYCVVAYLPLICAFRAEFIVAFGAGANVRVSDLLRKNG